MADLAHAAENDTDLFGDHDASHWAERFVARRREWLRNSDRDIAEDEGAMQAWFAGAIETGTMPDARRS